METLNESLFLWLNAADPSATSLLIARLCANGLVYVFPLYLVVSWLRSGPTGRDALIQATLSAVIALTLSWAIARVWHHPRPFVIGLGHQYIPHRPNASFPSNHLSFIWAICAGLYLYPVRRKAALLLGLVGVPVAWARVYLGVHFPLDMVGALITAVGAALLTRPLRARQVPRLRRCIEPIYRILFAWPIRKGWVRA